MHWGAPYVALELRTCGGLQMMHTLYDEQFWQFPTVSEHKWHWELYKKYCEAVSQTLHYVRDEQTTQ
jgi:hypothetical protein